MDVMLVAVIVKYSAVSIKTPSPGNRIVVVPISAGMSKDACHWVELVGPVVLDTKEQLVAVIVRVLMSVMVNVSAVKTVIW